MFDFFYKKGGYNNTKSSASSTTLRSRMDFFSLELHTAYAAVYTLFCVVETVFTEASRHALIV